jgi:DNA polymerase III subunit delta'
VKKSSETNTIIKPYDQLRLFGYKSPMKGFIKIFEKNSFPKQLLITAPKGSGKSTFIYHFVNFILSKNELNTYNTNDFSIDPNNATFKLINQHTHPNFFLIRNLIDDKNIKIEQTKLLIKFLNKSTYSKSLKIVMIDNAELLNINASNALLKIIEEPDEKTFFFIIQDSEKPILKTIKSRCIEYKLFLDFDTKVNIFQYLYDQYFEKNESKSFSDTFLNKLHYQSPGSLLKYTMFLHNNNLDLNVGNYEILKFLLNKYYKDKDSQTLSFIPFFIQFFYRDLFKLGGSKLNKSIHNYSNILLNFKNMSTYNLDTKNIVNWTLNIIENEQK